MPSSSGLPGQGTVTLVQAGSGQHGQHILLGQNQLAQLQNQPGQVMLVQYQPQPQQVVIPQTAVTVS